MKASAVNTHFNYVKEDIKSLRAKLQFLTQRVSVLESKASKSKNK